MILKNLFNHIGCVLSRDLKNVTNNISGIFYLRTSSLRHKILQDNIGSAKVRSDWESSFFHISGSCTRFLLVGLSYHTQLTT